MQARPKLIATVLAAAIAAGTIAGPVFGEGPYVPPPPPPPPAPPPAGGTSAMPFPWPVACVGGSALGLIAAAAIKSHERDKGQPRTKAKAKNDRELTHKQALLIAVTCGLGFFVVLPKLHEDDEKKG